MACGSGIKILFSPSRYFMVSTTAKYGNCFTFNHETNDDDDEAGKRYMAVTGNHHGKTRENQLVVVVV